MTAIGRSMKLVKISECFFYTCPYNKVMLKFNWSCKTPASEKGIYFTYYNGNELKISFME